MTGAWLVLPTYNEAENIGPLVRAALAALQTTGMPHRVLIVDDNSPDGTGDIADRLAGELEPVEVLHRERKQGLGRAYLAGFGRALEGGAELVMEMDSDFSHDPRDIPRLVAAAEAADLVLGSRYVPGGGISNWGLLRRFVSRGGSAYARWLLGVPVRDLTGGFKCFNRRVLEGIDLTGVHADGYGFQIELTYRAIKAGFTVAEVPIVFREREVGSSKMSTWIALEAVWKVPALRLRGR
ncbi:MAG TPA: polyprenol monophosphomannose synthase [Thermoleophilaceae bacterium]|nr:polyprenol monophosphomannose synthase [Thermoleophilaceae bacterium]